MPFVEPREPFATPPRLPAADPTDDWDGQLQVDDGWALLRDVVVTSSLPLDGCRELELVNCTFEGISFAEAPGIQLEVNRCHFTTCDLSQTTALSLNKARFDGCKFIGTDLSGSTVEDVAFVGGVLRYANLRMASYRRVAFANLTLDEVDLYDSKLEQVTFDGCELNKVVFDKCKLDHVDLRQATQLGITAASGLEGALISNEQVIELAYLFALASGIGIERTSED